MHMKRMNDSKNPKLNNKSSREKNAKCMGLHNDDEHQHR